MSTKPTHAQELLRIIALVGMARRDAAELAGRVGEAGVLRVIRDASLLLGRGSEAGAALALPSLLAECEHLGLLTPAMVAVAAGSTIAASSSSSGYATH